MIIYNEFVFEDRLISPINGKSYRRICKQNIKNFGFNDIEELHSLYPEFPLGCADYENSRNSNMSMTNRLKCLRLKLNKEQQKINDEIEYNLNPKICTYCGNAFIFSKRKLKYCSSKCRCSITSKARGHHSQATKIKIGLGVSLNAKNNPKIKSTADKISSKFEKISSNKISHENQYSSQLVHENKICRLFINTCNETGKKFCSRYWQKYHPLLLDTKLDYTRQCKFKFGLRLYPLWFDLSLLEKHGMYCTPGSGRNGKSNPNGISRDHMISITHGWENNIDPKILSHPANCQLMLHKENSRKNMKNSITLEMLHERIKLFSQIYPYFHE